MSTWSILSEFSIGGFKWNRRAYANITNILALPHCKLTTAMLVIGELFILAGLIGSNLAKGWLEGREDPLLACGAPRSHENLMFVSKKMITFRSSDLKCSIRVNDLVVN